MFFPSRCTEYFRDFLLLIQEESKYLPIPRPMSKGQLARSSYTNLPCRDSDFGFRPSAFFGLGLRFRNSLRLSALGRKFGDVFISGSQGQLSLVIQPVDEALKIGTSEFPFKGFCDLLI